MEIRDLYDGERKLTGETIVKGEKRKILSYCYGIYGKLKR